MSLTKQQMSKWLKDLNVLRVCKYQDEIRQQMSTEVIVHHIFC